MATTKKTSKSIPVLITTKHRGVFFGYADENDVSKDTIRLSGARNCIAWKRSIGGVFGLANVGPNAECRIGARMQAVTIRDVTAVVECTPGAAKTWEEAPCVS